MSYQLEGAPSLDWAVGIFVLDRDQGEFVGWHYGPFSSDSGASVSFSATGLDDDHALPPTRGEKAGTEGVWVHQPGNYTVYFLVGASTRVVSATFGVLVDGSPDGVAWVDASSAGFLTLRDLDGGDHVWAQAIGLGASAAHGASHAFAVSQHLVGFSLYDAGPADVHSITLEGPQGVRPADHLKFLADPPGDYTLLLHPQASAGEWPGRWVMLYADLP